MRSCWTGMTITAGAETRAPLRGFVVVLAMLIAGSCGSAAGRSAHRPEKVAHWRTVFRQRHYTVLERSKAGFQICQAVIPTRRPYRGREYSVRDYTCSGLSASGSLG